MDSGSVSSLQASISNSSSRSTPVPSNYKPLTPSSSVLALSNMPDDEMRRRGSEEMVAIVRRLENEYRGVISEHGSIMKDVNKKMQILLLEVRGLKDINQNLQDDNQELRDLCCFLDDDRQRGRKLAREWQRFGRYTASVMRSEVSAYQEKLKELEQKQQELIVDNLELKELCLFLDQERLRVGQTRDEGDGSSSSTVAGGDELQSDIIELLPVNQLLGSNNGTANSEYVQRLEEQIRHLEDEKRALSQDIKKSKHAISPGSKAGSHAQPTGSQRLGPDGNPAQDRAKSTSPNKPEAVVHAMKVLEVHENLERPHTTVGEENLDDKEKAIVREMCNVVWRKLGNVSAEQQESGTSTPQQHPVYENIHPGADRASTGELRGDPQMHQSYPPSSYQHQYHQGQPSRLNSDMGPGPSYSQNSRSQLDHGGASGIYTAQPLSQPQRSQAGHGYSQQGSQFSGQGRGYPPQSSQGQGQSQRPPPSSSYQSSGQAPGSHSSSQPPSYGYVRTTHSTPVTPTPMQRSHSPASKLHSVSNPNIRQDPRSHSPGPNRNPQPRPEPQTPSKRDQGQSSAHLYQKHPMGKGDHSYENIQYGFNPTSEGRSMQQVQSTSRNDHPPPPSISSHYTHSADIPAPSPGYATQGYPQPPNDHYQGNPSSAHYQNVHVQQPHPSKQQTRRTRDPSPQGYGMRQGSNQGPPQQGAYRNMQSGLTYSQQYPPPNTPQVTRRPAQQNQYSRDGYHADPRQYQDGRGRQNPYN